MKRQYRAALAWLTLLVCALSCAAQRPDRNSESLAGRPAPTGTVAGRVSLDDTKAPARRASVYLQPVAGLLEDAPPGQSRSQATQATTMSVETGFDGGFSFAHVPVGAYYVIASSPGYVSPYIALSLAEARSADGPWQPLGPLQAAVRKAVVDALPRVNVGSSLPAPVDITLERGGAISGYVTYDEGGPATGLTLNVLSKVLQNGKESWAPMKPPATGFPEPVKTDDRGYYRFNGLPAGKYLVQVTLDLSNEISYFSTGSISTINRSVGQAAVLNIYSGSTSRPKDATPFNLDLGEERTGEDLRIPLSKLHTITGTIVSAHDGHVVNDGEVLLQRADDHSVAGSASLSEEKPFFTLNFIYEGDYILSSPSSMDVDYEVSTETPGTLSPVQYNKHSRRLYGASSQPLHVAGDIDGVTIAVPDQP